MPNNGAATVLEPQPDEPKQPTHRGRVFSWPLNGTKGATHTFMTKIDDKAKERIELSRGTVWLLATVLVLAGVIFSYGSSMLGWIREDQSHRTQLSELQKDSNEMRQDMADIKRELSELQKTLQNLAIKDAEKRGYELKAAEGEHGQQSGGKK